MDTRFESIASHPSNKIFNAVFFPDRVYHAEYLNATRSPRYRYNVTEVRSKASMQALKGEVFLDGEKLCNFLRIEYRSGRLVEQAREAGRFMGKAVIIWLNLQPEGLPEVAARVRLEYCPWIDAFQGEIWETLETKAGQKHDFKVLQMMGKDSSITSIPAFRPALMDLKKLKRLNIAAREDYTDFPSGYSISDANSGWDNFYLRNIQVPNTQIPSDNDANTVPKENYTIDFQRNFFIPNVADIDPVRYRNPMMDDGHPRAESDNIVDMRWVFQEELGGNLVFFHEVTIPPGVTEGTHQHIGSEELYYIVEGTGIAYMGANDAPELADYPLVDESVFGLETKKCRQVPVKKGSVIFTKSGGIHGIRNESDTTPLKFIAFLYHSN